MPCCLVALVAIGIPRIALIVMWLTGYGQQAWAAPLWPILGFIFMPYTACGYALAVNSFGGTQGMGLVVIIIGVVLDLGSHGGSARYRRR